MNIEKTKTYMAVLLKGLFFVFFLGLLAAILYVAQLLRR